MSTILAGRFEQASQTDRAASDLAAHGVARDAVSIFYVTPAGQHDHTAIGGDQHESPGAERADTTAAFTGAAAAVGTGVVGGAVAAAAGLAAPVAAVAAIGAAAAGAYGGSLAGALGGTTDPGNNAIRHAGMMVAVRADGLDEAMVLDALRAAGAVDLEKNEGTWQDGEWTDFDPTRPPRLVQGTPREPRTVSA